MPDTVKAERRGACPYCDGGHSFSATQRRHGSQILRLCAGCGKWSMQQRNGVAYPLQDPSDPASSPTRVAHV